MTRRSRNKNTEANKKDDYGGATKHRGRFAKWASTRRWTIAGVILATVIGLIQVVIAIQTRPEDPQVAEDHYIANLRDHSTKAPDVKDAPYLFVVVNTGKEGLNARTTNDKNGTNEGFAPNHAKVWAECVTRSSFTPPGKKTVGPVWLKVKWPWPTGQPDPASQVHQSSPNDRDHAWMYRGYLEPSGQNGNIPSC